MTSRLRLLVKQVQKLLTTYFRILLSSERVKILIKIIYIADEEWNADQAETSLYLMNGNSHVTLPRPLSRHHQELSKSPDSSPKYSKYHQESPPKYKPVKQEEKPNGFSRRAIDRQVRYSTTTKNHITLYSLGIVRS